MDFKPQQVKTAWGSSNNWILRHTQKTPKTPRYTFRTKEHGQFSWGGRLVATVMRRQRAPSDNAQQQHQEPPGAFMGASWERHTGGFILSLCNDSSHLGSGEIHVRGHYSRTRKGPQQNVWNFDVANGLWNTFMDPSTSPLPACNLVQPYYVKCHICQKDKNGRSKPRSIITFVAV